MSLELDAADRYEVRCNHLGCSAVLETREGRLAAALRIAEHCGWLTRPGPFKGVPPAHFCPEHR